MNFTLQTLFCVMILACSFEYGTGKDLSRRGRGSHWRQRSLRNLMERTEKSYGGQPTKEDKPNPTSTPHDNLASGGTQDSPLDKSKPDTTNTDASTDTSASHDTDSNPAGTPPADDASDKSNSYTGSKVSPTSKPQSDDTTDSSASHPETPKPAGTPPVDDASDKSDSYTGSKVSPTSKPQSDDTTDTSESHPETPNPVGTPPADDASDKSDSYAGKSNLASPPKEDDASDTSDSDVGSKVDATSKPKKDGDSSDSYAGGENGTIESYVGKLDPTIGNHLKKILHKLNLTGTINGNLVKKILQAIQLGKLNPDGTINSNLVKEITQKFSMNRAPQDSALSKLHPDSDLKEDSATDDKGKYRDSSHESDLA